MTEKIAPENAALEAALDRVRKEFEVHRADAAVPIGLSGASAGKTEANFPARMFVAPANYTQELDKVKFYRDKFGANVSITPDPVLYETEKLQKEGEQKAVFQQYVASKFDLSDPLQVAQLEKFYPEFFDERIDLALSKLETLKKVVLLQMRGIRSMDDVITNFELDSGQIEIPKEAVNYIIYGSDLNQARSQSTKVNEHFQRGVFNPRKGGMYNADGNYSISGGLNRGPGSIFNKRAGGAAYSTVLPEYKLPSTGARTQTFRAG